VTGLQSNRLFSQLSAAEWQKLEQAAKTLTFPAGHEIFKEGDPGDAIYLIKSGEVRISALTESGERYVFSKVGPSGIFGEMAVLDDKPRSASAVADSETVAYCIPRQYILDLFKRSPEFTLALVRDISHRLRDFNHQYIRNVLQVERLSLIGRFASSIVHDLKSPLATIQMAAELSGAEKISFETRKMACERIQKQVERITFMVNDILEFTRGGESSSAAKMSRTNYAQFVRSTLDELKDDVAEHRVTLRIDGAPPAVDVLINPNRLGRVFHNLIGNALDEMPRGGAISIRFSVEPREIATEIHDTGKGIAPEIATRLFEPFTTHGKTKGTGLGLSICQRIVEEHGGKISARNPPEGGAAFRFTLPQIN
jgi:signal transduction histidine kinase